MENAFYEPAGSGNYLSTPATIGPWSRDAQHGGPPSALAVTALEQHEPDERQRLGRVSIDILRPVPIGKLSVRTRMVRPGRKVALLEAIMEADGQEVLHARGWRIERPSRPVPEILDGTPAPLLPATGDGVPPQIFKRDPDGYLASIEWRFLPSELDEYVVAGLAGPAQSPRTAMTRAAWARPRIPLLPDEESSPMARTLLVADSGSGVGAALPANEFIFINVDVSVALPRDPAGDWLLLEAETVIGADGAGLATCRLSDLTGPCGQAWQTLLVAPR
ncbi:MAG: thioesterase family protein [Nocardiopsaceae bacterium]|nr:thioesterase family protein [Nocardiopsaceae bacterium]